MEYWLLCLLSVNVYSILTEVFVSGLPSLISRIVYAIDTKKIQSREITVVRALPVFGGQIINSNNINENMAGYGITWLYFPDGDEIPRKISLTFGEMNTRRLKMFSDSDDIEYRLYTRSNPDDPIILDSSAKPARDSNVTDRLSKVPLKIVTHGWESSADKNAVINIKNAYLATKDVIVIAVDWSPIADSAFYPIVAYQTKYVGAYIGHFLDALSDRYNVDGNQIHLIGHSLGAHVMGRAASTSKLTVNRITGLDPARPFFEIPETSEKLDITDAKFVDVIHTCSGLLGIFNGAGHADFYPNDGIAPQPGCQGIQGYMEACSHSRSHYLYTESIYNPKAFPAYQCADWSDYVRGNCTASSYLGEGANLQALGHFYLQTNQYSPYGRGLERDTKK